MKKFITIYFAITVGMYFTGIEPELGGLVLRPSDLLLIFIIAMDILNSAFNHNKLPSFFGRNNRIAIFLVLSFSYRFFVAIFKADAGIAIREMIQSIEYLILFFYIGTYISNYYQREKYFKYMQLICILISIYCALYHISQGIITGYKKLDEARLSFGIGALFSFYFFLRKKNFTSVCLLVLSLSMMILSGERKGWIAFMLGATYLNFFLIDMPKVSFSFVLNRMMVPALMLGVYFIMNSILADNVYYERQESTFDELPFLISDFQSNLRNINRFDASSYASRSDASRYFTFIAGIYEFQKSPIVGIGPQNFKKKVQELSPVDWIDHGAHNEYLNTLVEYGSVGLFLLLAILVTVFRKLRRIKKYLNIVQLQQKALIMGLFIYMSTINFFDGGGDAINLVFICFPAALVLGLSKEQREEIIRLEMLKSRAKKLQPA